MKTIYKSLIAAALALPVFTGCIEESIPTNTVLATQLEGNSNAVTAFAMAMPSHLNVITVAADQHYDWGWPSLMHVRDVMTEDMSVLYAGGYDWFATWSRNGNGLGSRYMVCQFPWNFYYEQILTINNTIKVIDPDTPDAGERYYLGAAYAYRAATYLDAGRMYEVLPTAVDNGKDETNTNDIIGLTLPIVTDQTSQDDMRNNPRAPHATLFEFIVNDLENAIPLMQGFSRPNKTMPDVAVAYGLLARAYLWDASFQAEVNADNAAAATSYGKAAEYARKAINESGAIPLTQAQTLNVTSGFNDITVSSWLWGGQYSAEDDVVTAGGIRTWTSFCSNQQNFGYAAPAQGAFTEIGASMYNRINDADFRKLLFVAPEDSPLAGTEPILKDEEFRPQFEPYVSLKFRPAGGETEDYLTGAVVGYPMMRVEEMYFIEAEATAHTNPGAGRSLLDSFMKTYRYATYNPNVSSDAALIDEIVFQKRVELWGEGQTFFDVKRLNMSVTRWYNGTNFTEASNTFNTEGRPAWMNFVIVQQETSNNTALVGYNTPSPAGKYKAATSED